MFPPRTFRYNALVQITHLRVLQSSFGTGITLLTFVNILTPVHIHSSLAPMTTGHLAHVVVAKFPSSICPRIGALFVHVTSVLAAVLS
jgi:hypothetical protein